MNKVQEFWSGLTTRIKALVIGGGAALVVAAVIVGLIINNKPYAVLFNSVSTTEAQQIIAKLQEDQTPYQYQNNDILVPTDVLDITKAKLVTEGYPQSGFTYDVFRNNVGLMTTESDRERYELYDLETRIGATIRVFEGVREAYVTIALGTASAYALEDEQTEASAQVVVVMEDGSSPSPEMAKSIQLLVSRSIPDLIIDNVAVFDGNGLEVSRTVGNSTTQVGRENEEIAQLIEGQISSKVLNMLGAVYGNGNVRIAVKAKVNMEKLLREVTTYSTPEKIDEEDKDGILSEESWYSEYSGDGTTAAGVAGAESNADIPQYNTGGTAADNAYGAVNRTRQYMINQIREQGQVDPGSLDDLTISVVINGESFGGLQLQQLRDLIGNAAGMAPEDREAKITVASVPFYTVDVPEPPVAPVSVQPDGSLRLLPYVVVGGVVFILLLLILIALLVRRKKKKKKAAEPVAAVRRGEAPKKKEPVLETEDSLLELDNDKGIELRKGVRDFAEQNPEISAQLLKSWLNGGEGEQ